jgi:hypothetical protein
MLRRRGTDETNPRARTMASSTGASIAPLCAATGLGKGTCTRRQLGFTTVDDGLDLVEQAYPGRPIPAKVKFLLTEIVDSMQR